MDIGRMRKRVQVQVNTQVADGLGQMRDSWGTVGTYWARIEEMHGWERANAMQLKATASHKISMRYVGSVTPITPSNRLLYVDPTLGPRYFYPVEALNIDEMRREYKLTCEEIVPLR